MRNTIIAFGALALIAACNPNADTDNAAIATEDAVAERQAEAPAAGANSFTEGQARDRLTERGFTDPIQLTQSPDGTWQGTATQNGQSVQVTVDYQGNVTTTGQGASATPAAPAGQ